MICSLPPSPLSWTFVLLRGCLAPMRVPASSLIRLSRSRQCCHRRPGGAPDEIDETDWVGQLRVAAPGDMLVRTHKHEPAAIQLRRLRRSDVENGKWKAALRCRRHDAINTHRGVEPQ